MNYDLRYDGPDIEGEAGARSQNLLTLGAMGLAARKDGKELGRRNATDRASKADAQALSADQSVWRDTPTGAEVGGLDDEAIARRWAACAAHPDQPDANEVRGRLEAELARRDPETMRDYRSWRNAAADPPGEAMRKALAERDARLVQVWKPLTEHGVAAMGADEVADRWAAAHAAHGHDHTDRDGNVEDVKKARAAGQERLAELDPGRVDAWTALQAAQPSPVKGMGARPGLSPADAAARTSGRVGAFLPSPGDGATLGWGAVAKGGVKVATTTARTTPAAPLAAAGQATAKVTLGLHQAMSRAMRP